MKSSSFYDTAALSQFSTVDLRRIQKKTQRYWAPWRESKTWRSGNWQKDPSSAGLQALRAHTKHMKAPKAPKPGRRARGCAGGVLVAVCRALCAAQLGVLGGLTSAALFVCLFVCLFTDSRSRRSVALLRVEPTLPEATSAAAAGVLLINNRTAKSTRSDRERTAGRRPTWP